MKRNYNRRMILLFVFEVLIPIICIPLLPFIFSDCSSENAFLIGTSVSIFIAVWEFRYEYHERSNNYLITIKESKQNFDYIYHQLKLLHMIHEFKCIINEVSHPYFKKQVSIEFEKYLHSFKENNRELINQYIETTPYSNNTFGIEGLTWTKNSLLAVSSIEDYWDRDNFINEYLEKQYFMIKNKKVEITRIFIISKDNLNRFNKLLKGQKQNGIKVYYIDSKSDYFNRDWLKEDFLIQDNVLLVDLQSKTHKYNQIGREIITADETLVSQKIEIFNKMLECAIRF